MQEMKDSQSNRIRHDSEELGSVINHIRKIGYDSSP
jgi:hypothetical protein